jgi:cytochrome c553
MQFNVSLSGTANPNVSWSLSPPVGTVSGGLYQAPATISTHQTVSVTAASLADPTKTASAVVSLVPTLGIALTPSSISLTGGQSTQFIASLAGTSTTAVTWTLAPLVGTITNGVYTAPVTINALQTIVLTVASMADPTQTATATITLGAAPSTSVNPSQATLTPSQTQQFTASGLGTSPNWTLSPATGTISTTGLYKAPNTVLTQTTVTVMATNATDATKAASAVVTLEPAADQTPPPTTITLPIEVMGDAGTSVPVQFSISSSANLSGQVKLWLQIHGLKYQTEASVQVNSGAWLPINDTTVALQGLAKSYGGIGGGFSTLKLTMNLPSGAIVAGTNTLTVRFNGTDGITSGFRVLNLNVLGADGSQLISPSSFTLDDPGTWQPPLNTSADIAAGHTLFTSANLTAPGSGAIHAKCSSCHAQDGRDLKYFNYSNFSIRSRAIFHGLTAQQGDQIATYIRSLNILVPAKARPWNPPYQPGPGTDSSPVSDWAAGAGIDGVLDQDSDMMPALMPGGSMAGWAPTANLSAREIPTAVQFLDWNRWLPTVYPGDAFGSTFTNNQLFTQYQAIRGGLIPGNATSYKGMAPQIWLLGTYMYNFRIANEPALTDPSWNALKGQQIYSIAQWLIVKHWEINQEFELEGMPQVPFGPQADARAWYSPVPFQVSPNMLHIPLAGNLDNGKNSTRTYLAYIWYHLQLVLNAGNGQFVENSPMDLGYVYGFVAGGLAGSNDVPASVRNGPLMLLWLIKASQASNHLPGPDKKDFGWSPNANRVQHLFDYANLGWRDLPQATAGSVMEQMLTLWLAKVKTFTPQQFYTGGWTKSSEIPNPQWPDSSFANWVASMIPPAQYFGVSHTLLTNIAAWAKTMWPNYNWANLLNANCAPYQGIALNCPVP